MDQFLIRSQSSKQRLYDQDIFFEEEYSRIKFLISIEIAYSEKKILPLVISFKGWVIIDQVLSKHKSIK